MQYDAILWLVQVANKFTMTLLVLIPYHYFAFSPASQSPSNWHTVAAIELSQFLLRFLHTNIHKLHSLSPKLGFGFGQADVLFYMHGANLFT